MKKLIASSLLLFMFTAMLPTASFAQAPAAAPAVSAPAAAPATPAVEAPKEILPAPPAATYPIVQVALSYVESIPAVGKILSIIFQILAVLGVGLTALASILIVVKTALAQAGQAVWAPLGVAADWIEALLPWVKYLSMYNAHPAPADQKKV
jgi:hypothetical protein